MSAGCNPSGKQHNSAGQRLNQSGKAVRQSNYFREQERSLFASPLCAMTIRTCIMMKSSGSDRYDLPVAVITDPSPVLNHFHDRPGYRTSRKKSFLHRRQKKQPLRLSEICFCRPPDNAICSRRALLRKTTVQRSSRRKGMTQQAYPDE